MTESWIIFKTQTLSAHGWEDRKLMPSGSITEILWENWNYSGTIPQVGDRVKAYAGLEDEDHITHEKDDDWVVSNVQHFTSPDTEQKIIVCQCEYQPVQAEWQELKRGAPANELLESASV